MDIEGHSVILDQEESDPQHDIQVFYCPKCGYRRMFQFGETQLLSEGDGSNHYWFSTATPGLLWIESVEVVQNDPDVYNKLFFGDKKGD